MPDGSNPGIDVSRDGHSGNPGGNFGVSASRIEGRPFSNGPTGHGREREMMRGPALRAGAVDAGAALSRSLGRGHGVESVLVSDMADIEDVTRLQTVPRPAHGALN